MINAIPSRVYVIEGPNKTVKVGRSKNPELRAKQLSWFAGGSTKVVFTTEILQAASTVECLAHDMLAPTRITDEWYAVSAQEAISVVLSAVKKAKGIYDAVEKEALEKGITGSAKNTLYIKHRWPPGRTPKSKTNHS